jgi:hypothetical protein
MIKLVVVTLIIMLSLKEMQVISKSEYVFCDITFIGICKDMIIKIDNLFSEFMHRIYIKLAE